MAGTHWNKRNLNTSTSPGLVPAGLIIMWSGSQVPPGWALCNGQNGTPDLRDRFIVGAGGSYAVGAKGGTVTNEHVHDISGTTSGPSGSVSATGPFLFNQNYSTTSHTHTYSGQTGSASVDNRPPYYALAFIQKLSYTPPSEEGAHYNEGNLGDDSGLLPRGAILIWSGSVSSIPAGWALCNGQNGTPDLRDRFIVGAGGSYAIGAKGGSATTIHSHTVSLAVDAATQSIAVAAVSGATAALSTHLHTISGQTDSVQLENRPPYYALCYIMRVA